MIVRLAFLSALVHMAEDAEAELGILVQNLPLRSVLGQVLTHELRIGARLLDESADLFAALGPGLGGEEAVTIGGELFECIGHRLILFSWIGQNAEPRVYAAKEPCTRQARWIRRAPKRCRTMSSGECSTRIETKPQRAEPYMDRDPAPAPTPPPASSQGLARIALATAVVGIGLWILRDFLAALVWAGVPAVAFLPVYRRLQIPVSRPIERVVAPALATTVIGIIFIAPLVLLGIALARESHFVVDFIRDARHHGIPAPVWIGQLPIIGASITDWWRTNLGDPVAAEELIGRVNLRTLTESAREYGGEVVHRLALLLFTLLTLFFVFRDGDRLAEQLRRLGDQLIG